MQAVLILQRIHHLALLSAVLLLLWQSSALLSYSFGTVDTNAKQKQAEIKNEIRSSSSQLALALRPMPIAVQVPELKGISILRL